MLIYVMLINTHTKIREAQDGNGEPNPAILGRLLLGGLETAKRDCEFAAPLSIRSPVEFFLAIKTHFSSYLTRAKKKCGSPACECKLVSRMDLVKP